MDVIDDLAKARLRQETILTIGAFDGLHRGHQALIRGVVEQAQATDRLSAVVTFHPHPAMVLAPERGLRYLTTPGEKLALLEGLGVDLTVLLPFNRQVAAMSARDFMELVSRHLRLRELWIGPGFSLGHDREGNLAHLREVGQELGYQIRVIEPVSGPVSALVSSSRIRELLAQGAVDEAALLLGRYPSLSGEVVAGARRGHKLGFPTANLEVRPERAVPADGVYAVYAVLGTERYPAVANVGVRPSFDNGHRTVETHILDFDQDIYGCDLVVEFVARLRDERRFEHIDDLIAQIEQDSAAARRILSSQGGTPVACPYRYQEVEHTADRALQVWARQLPDLFVGAARGMSSLMTNLDGLTATDWREIRLESWDLESLLVDWLNELLFLTETEGLVFVDFRVEQVTDTVLTAQAGGAKAPRARGIFKAATYDDLKVDHGETGWSTVITFDV